MKIISSLSCTQYGQLGHPESPERVKESHAYLKSKGYEIVEPQPATEKDILLVHTQQLFDQVKTGSFSDADTPFFEDIIDHALLSAGAAIQAAEISLAGDFGFSLMRPPGHHATQDTLGGFCYFNNIAIASKKILPKAKRIAILDIDVHHGNGTQDFVKGEKDILFVSLHQSPLYPGSGLQSEQNCLNFPLTPGTTEERYLEIIQEALNSITQFKPDIIGMSCGFDTFADDPLANIELGIESYKKIGQTVLALKIPVFEVLEGGYSQSLPQCIESFLMGLTNT
ncbi:histone deacetylase family protein [Candidatus Omnitrophota bacterium]